MWTKVASRAAVVGLVGITGCGGGTTSGISKEKLAQSVMEVFEQQTQGGFAQFGWTRTLSGPRCRDAGSMDRGPSGKPLYYACFLHQASASGGTTFKIDIFSIKGVCWEGAMVGVTGDTEPEFPISQALLDRGTFSIKGCTNKHLARQPSTPSTPSTPETTPTNESSPQPAVAGNCKSVIFKPGTDAAAAEVRVAGGLSCTTAESVLRLWAQDEYEGNGPAGFECQHIPTTTGENGTKYHCTRPDGQVLEFTTY